MSAGAGQIQGSDSGQGFFLAAFFGFGLRGLKGLTSSLGTVNSKSRFSWSAWGVVERVEQGDVARRALDDDLLGHRALTEL